MAYINKSIKRVITIISSNPKHSPDMVGLCSLQKWSRYCWQRRILTQSLINSNAIRTINKTPSEQKTKAHLFSVFLIFTHEMIDPTDAFRRSMPALCRLVAGSNPVKVYFPSVPVSITYDTTLLYLWKKGKTKLFLWVCVNRGNKEIVVLASVSSSFFFNLLSKQF